MSDPLTLSVTRLIDAPRDVVWRAFTEHMEQWFCPAPWRAEVVAYELRPGGRCAFVMHGPDGEAMPNEGVVLEVVPGERIVTSDAYRAGWVPATPFMTGIWEFADEDGKTRYTASARHWTPEAMAQHRDMGFEAGWSAAAAQLEQVALSLKASADA